MMVIMDTGDLLVDILIGGRRIYGSVIGSMRDLLLTSNESLNFDIIWQQIRVLFLERKEIIFILD